MVTSVVIGCLCGCSKLEVQPSESDLVFNDLASVWDEAMPLGNASVGELVWQKGDNLRLSLDRIDLWDLRPVDVFNGEEYSFEDFVKNDKSGVSNTQTRASGYRQNRFGVYRHSPVFHIGSPVKK